MLEFLNVTQQILGRARVKPIPAQHSFPPDSQIPRHTPHIDVRAPLLPPGHPRTHTQCLNSDALKVLVTQSCPTLVTPWTVAHQAPLSMEFSRQEYWSGLPFPSPEALKAQPNLTLEKKLSLLQKPPLTLWYLMVFDF